MALSADLLAFSDLALQDVILFNVLDEGLVIVLIVPLVSLGFQSGRRSVLCITDGI